MFKHVHTESDATLIQDMLNFKRLVPLPQGHKQDYKDTFILSSRTGKNCAFPKKKDAKCSLNYLCFYL